MSERQLYYTYCTGCWLETGRETRRVPCYCTVLEVIFCLAFSFPKCPVWPLVSLGRGRGSNSADWKLTVEMQGNVSLLVALVWAHCLPCWVASATSVHPMACMMAFAIRGKKGLLPWKPESTVTRGKNRPEKKKKKKSPKYQLSSIIHLLSLFLCLAIHFSLPSFLSFWTELTHSNSLHILI